MSLRSSGGMALVGAEPRSGCVFPRKSGRSDFSYGRTTARGTRRPSPTAEIHTAGALYVVSGIVM